MRILRAVALVLMAACFDPQAVDGALVCGAPPDVCPPGFACVDGHCFSDTSSPGGTPDAPIGIDMDFDAPDMMPPPHPDAGMMMPPPHPDAGMMMPPPHPDAGRRPQCSDGIDNDCDGLIDWPFDPGCTGPDDDDEHGTKECDDGIDNDGDGRADFRIGTRCGLGDTKCHSPSGNNEH